MLGMVAGIATSGGFLIAGEACFPWNRDSEMCSYQSFLISTSWMTSGLLTLIQVFRFKIKGTPFYIGTGLISVMGTSFTFLPLGQEIVASGISACRSNGDPRCVGGDCMGCGLEAYGKYIGTAITASLFEIVIAILPKKIRDAIFPPVICGIALMMIGIGLIGSGMKYYGGGVFCAQNMLSRSATFGGPHICNESGEVQLAFGAPEYIGLATSVVLFGVLVQCLGSPFLKSTFIFWSLCFGCFVSGVSRYHGGGTEQKYWTPGKVDAAPAVTFFWAGGFGFVPFSFAPEYFIPMLICSYVTTAETVGDVLMTCQFSAISETEEVNKRIQGGIMADGINSVIAGICGSPPNTTFSGNNGIIAISRCAWRSAGFSCGIWLFLLGMIGKLGASFASIPIPVVGGMVLQTFTMVFVAGLELVGKAMNRRNSYLIMVSLCFGLGVAMEPQVFQGNGVASYFGKNLDFNYGLWPKKMVCSKFPTETVTVTAATCMVGTTDLGLDSAKCTIAGGSYKAAVTKTVPDTDCVNKNGFCCLAYDAGGLMMRTTLLIILKTPYAIAPIIAMILNFILPVDKDGDDMPSKDSAEIAAA